MFFNLGKIYYTQINMEKFRNFVVCPILFKTFPCHLIILRLNCLHIVNVLCKLLVSVFDEVDFGIKFIGAYFIFFMIFIIFENIQ